MAVATLTTPETQPSGAKIIAHTVHIAALEPSVTLTFLLQDAGQTSTIRTATYTYFAADYTSFCTALGSARSGESGSVANRLQFRVIGWMADNSKFLSPTGTPIAVTVAP